MLDHQLYEDDDMMLRQQTEQMECEFQAAYKEVLAGVRVTIEDKFREMIKEGIYIMSKYRLDRGVNADLDFCVNFMSVVTEVLSRIPEIMST